MEDGELLLLCAHKNYCNLHNGLVHSWVSIDEAESKGCGGMMWLRSMWSRLLTIGN